ncbi:TIGR00730 family Rossman fold protein [Deinococcus maricopensis]|uniref:Cytokinin riboside 5'-monophosphate phosphoribohydrolase n=1 Tax=Deinococcus maricopensis (strain DSM 21211 / LMG 22137 / NRRL B-23946 / LB-34) TaxID=709986 RepID=E8U8T4_DEIML|nr:TIGR00730 family Rossman fold protein [Deinococcus maricopensis]ADV67473.1 Conserved hypothetical protein CHP00730 [Deinococcus maricopensis DSM 21211]
MTEHESLDNMTRDAWRMLRVLGELAVGFDRLAQLPHPGVTVFGSARTGIRDQYYGLARDLGAHLAASGFAVITGGGPGIMEAANRGAFEAGGVSVGINIILPYEQRPNPYQTISLECEYFHTRKELLAKAARAFVVFPGGFGTLDELAGILTLVQTRKMPAMPVYLVGRAHWAGLEGWFRETLITSGAIADDDLDLFKIVDDVSAIPADIQQYHAGEHAGFKRPTDTDRARARGDVPTSRGG